MVRHAAGPLRTWMQGLMDDAPTSGSERTQRNMDSMAGLDAPILKGGRRKKSTQTSYMAFMSSDLPQDEWPFAFISEHKRPIDFIQALSMDLDENDACEWLTFEQYLAKLKTATQAEALAMQARTEQANLSDKLPQAPVRAKPPL